MSKPVVSMGLLVVSMGALGCVAEPVDTDDTGITAPASASAAPGPEASASPASICAQPVIPQGSALGAFGAFRTVQARWTEALRQEAAQPAEPPHPPLLGANDPLAFEFVKQYAAGRVGAGQPNGFLPWGLPAPLPGPEDVVSLTMATSLMLSAGEAPSQLLRLTDFSTGTRTPRITALCEAYLASASDPSVAPLAALCASVGTSVSWRGLTDVKVDGIKLVRGKECALPSMAYGAFRSIGTTTPPLSFDWPNFLERDAKYRQPCVGVYLHVQASDQAGADVGDGWMFAKAVADYTAVPFPFTERDARWGNAARPGGAPRGEFVSTRELFASGTSLYLGTSPLWLFHRDEVRGFEDLVAGLEGRVPACDLSTPSPVTPCILPPQKPFLFPSRAQAVWFRQALDALHSSMEPGSPWDRNPNELYFDTSILSDVLSDVIKFYATSVFPTMTPAGLDRAGEQLGAMFHAFRLHLGRPDLERFRTPILALGDGYLLAVPDQGYFQLGTPTPTTLARLEALDLSPAMGVDRPTCGTSLFTFSDLVAKEQ